MAKFKAQQLHGKCVWRISERAPMGEWVDLSRSAEHIPPPPDLPEATAGGWVVSSFELLHGADIIEDSESDTVSSELLDQLFASPNDDPKGPSV